MKENKINYQKMIIHHKQRDILNEKENSMKNIEKKFMK